MTDSRRGSTRVCPLPPQELRMGGAHFQDDSQFVGTAVNDVQRLRDRAGLTTESRLLDWGCGAGRLAVGVKHELGHVRDYHGVDVQSALIRWAQENLADEHTRFSLVDSASARYNPLGRSIRSIPAEPGTIDVFYGYSVFSHMLVDDVAGYSRIVARSLARTGRAMVTAFVEDGVDSWTENPAGYGPFEWTGPLHCVRYERTFFENVLWQCGLAVLLFEYGQETDGQSLYLLRRADSAQA